MRENECEIRSLSPRRQLELVWAATAAGGDPSVPPADAGMCSKFVNGGGSLLGDAVLGADRRYHLVPPLLSREGMAPFDGGCRGCLPVLGESEVRLHPREVPRARWCERAMRRGYHPHWGTGQRRRIIEAVVELCGHGCGACATGWGSMIDHDHATGLVRGLVCPDCNSRTRVCYHAAGCRRGDYIDDPPALSLGLEYPGWWEELWYRNSERVERVRAVVDRLPISEEARELLLASPLMWRPR